MSDVDNPFISREQWERERLEAFGERLDEWQSQFNQQTRYMHQELCKAASAGLFLTAADLRDE